MKNFSQKSLITFLTGIGLFVSGVLSMVIISRILGPEGKGIYSLLILIPGMIMTFGNFGLGSGNVYFVGSGKYKLQEVVSNSLVLTVILGFLLIGIFWLMLQFDFFQNFIKNNQIPIFYLWITVLLIPLSLFLSFFQEIIRGKGEIKKYNKIKFLEGFLELILVVFFLLILKKGLAGAVFSYVLALILTAGFLFILIKKIAVFSFRLHKNLLKDSLVYGGKVYLANAISFLNYRFDMFLIAFFLNPAAVGLYSVAVGISERLFLIPGSFSTVLCPKVSASKEFEANAFTPKVVRHTLFLVIIFSFFLLILAKPLILIVFGSAFLPSIFPLIILLPGIIAFSIGGVIAADLSGRGKPQFAVYSSLACLIINLILNIILIPKWGIAGAALASSIAYWADTFVVLIAFMKISKKSLSEVLLIRKEDFYDYFRLFSIFKSSLLKIK